MTTEKTDMSDYLLKTMGNQLKNKNLKKILKKVQNDPKMFELINNLQKNMMAHNTQTDPNGTPQERVKERIKQCRLQRGGKIRQQYESEKVTKKDQPNEQQLDTTVKSDVQETVTSTISDVRKEKKKKNDRLKKLKKKYGTITLDQYTESLKKINDSQISTNETNHHRNIVELYVKQSNSSQEKILENDGDCDDENATSDVEIIDIESK